MRPNCCYLSPGTEVLGAGKVLALTSDCVASRRSRSGRRQETKGRTRGRSVNIAKGREGRAEVRIGKGKNKREGICE